MSAMNDIDDSEDRIESPDALFRTAVLFESGLGLLAIGLGVLFGPDARQYLPRLEDQPWWDLAVGVGGGLVAAVPMWGLVTLVRRLPFEAVRELERVGDEGLFRLLMQLSVPEMLVVSLAAGVGEELLFRGWLLPAVAGVTDWILTGAAAAGTDATVAMANPVAVAAAVIVSSIAFGLVHPITKLYVVLAAAIGLYLAALMLWTGNLLIPIVAHAAYDAIQMIVAKAQKDRPTEQQTAGVVAADKDRD